MKSFGAAALTALVVIFGGCASTPGGLRSDASATRVAVIDSGYQLVLKRLVDWSDECTASPVLPLGQVIDQVRDYPDLRQATIVRGASGVGTQIYLVIDLQEIEPAKTEMKVYSRAAPDRQMARHRRVANGGTGCD